MKSEIAEEEVNIMFGNMFNSEEEEQKYIEQLKNCKVKHKDCYMTIYGQYYCPDCDDMLPQIKKSKDPRIEGQIK